MNIFDIIDGIAFSKKNNLIDSPESEKEFSLYLVNRWLSMLDPLAAKVVNLTSNRNLRQFTTVQDQYKLLVNVLPRFKRQRINYIKKPKTIKDS